MTKIQDYLERKAVRNWHLDGDSHLSISLLEKPREIFGGRRTFETPLSDLILEELTRITHKSFGSELNEESADGVREHVMGADVISILHNGNALGFCSAKKLNIQGEKYLEKVLLIHGIVVSPEMKQNGYARKLLESVVITREGRRVALTTQSPIVYCLMESVIHAVKPAPDFRRIDPKLSTLSRGILSGRPGVVNQETSVVQNLYESCLYQQIPKCNRRSVDDWFNESLRIKNGRSRDGILLYGDMPYFYA